MKFPEKYGAMALTLQFPHVEEFVIENSLMLVLSSLAFVGAILALVGVLKLKDRILGLVRHITSNLVDYGLTVILVITLYQGWQMYHKSQRIYLVTVTLLVVSFCVLAGMRILHVLWTTMPTLAERIIVPDFLMDLISGSFQAEGLKPGSFIRPDDNPLQCHAIIVQRKGSSYEYVGQCVRLKNDDNGAERIITRHCHRI